MPLAAGQASVQELLNWVLSSKTLKASCSGGPFSSAAYHRLVAASALLLLPQCSPREGTDLYCINFCTFPFQAGDTQLRNSSSSSSSRDSGKPRCHFFSTFFVNKLYKDCGEYDYKEVYINGSWELKIRGGQLVPCSCGWPALSAVPLCLSAAAAPFLTS